MEHKVNSQRRALLGAVLALPLLLLWPFATVVQAANENYCPGSPWNCTTYTNCTDLTWCEENDWPCTLPLANFIHKKYLIVKRCTNGGQTQYCTACGGNVQTATCCDTPTNEAACPNGTACP